MSMTGVTWSLYSFAFVLFVVVVFVVVIIRIAVLINGTAASHSNGPWHDGFVSTDIRADADRRKRLGRTTFTAAASSRGASAGTGSTDSRG